jgi:hypothetical protein
VQESLGNHKTDVTLEDNLQEYCNDRQETEPPPIPISHINNKVTGDKTADRMLLAETCDKARTVWVIGQGAETATAAMSELRIEPIILQVTDKTKDW